VTTPHIAARPGDFADTVLLPGDPLRARHIAERFLEDATLVTDVRGMLGYTGTWNGQPISVMGSGMGIPSCCIYATELIAHFGVRRLLRVGTCGAVRGDVALGDLVLGLAASTDSNINRLRFRGLDHAAAASWPLLRDIAATAEARGVALHVGPIFSTDLFHADEPALLDHLERMGILGIEMEAAGLYGVAAEHGVQAATLLTVADHLRHGGAMSPEQRQRGLDRMIRLALDALRPATAGVAAVPTRSPSG
jgi:purine-nucleoside phosphorylase